MAGIFSFDPSTAYFHTHPYSDATGKTILGLFYTKSDLSDGVLYPLPSDVIKDRSLLGLINLYDKKDLLPYNKYNVPIEEKQFVALMGGGEKLITVLNNASNINVATYIPYMMDIINLWNRYELSHLNSTISSVIDTFIGYVTRENTTFWASRNDDMSGSLARRTFSAEHIKITPENKERVEAFKRAIEENNVIEEEFDYPGMEEEDEPPSEEKKKRQEDRKKIREEKKRKMGDLSEFLLKPLPIAEYYKDLARSDYRIIFQSADKFETTLSTKLFAAVCCSYKYYHLNLDSLILNTINKRNQPVVTSMYVRYLMYLAYREEKIYRTFSTPEHRHMMPREISSQLRMILQDSILPGYKTYTEGNWYNGNAHLNLGCQLFPVPETRRRMSLFMRGFDRYFTLPYPAKIYVCGSIMTASSIRVPRRLTKDEKEASYSSGGIVFEERGPRILPPLPMMAGPAPPPGYVAVGAPPGMGGPPPAGYPGYPAGYGGGLPLSPGYPHGIYPPAPPPPVAYPGMGLPGGLLPPPAKRAAPIQGSKPGFTDEGDLRWYDEKYSKSDVDIMVILPTDKEGKKDLTYVLMCAQLLGDTLLREGMEVRLEPVAFRWRVTASKQSTREFKKLSPRRPDDPQHAKDTCTFEFFPSYYGPTTLISKFHVPCVRSYLDPVANTIMDFPSFVYSAQTQYCIDFHAFTGTSTQTEVISKYIDRGFQFMLSKKEEKIMDHRLGHTHRWNVNLVARNARNKITGFLPGLPWPVGVKAHRAVSGKRLEQNLPVIKTLRKVRSGLRCHGVTSHPFWSKEDKHISLPKYPVLTKCPTLPGQLFPHNVIDLTPLPEAKEKEQRQAYIIRGKSGVLGKIFADGDQVSEAIPILNLPPSIYMEVNIGSVSPRIFMFVWNALVDSGINAKTWSSFTSWERESIGELLKGLQVPADNPLSTWMSFLVDRE